MTVGMYVLNGTHLTAGEYTAGLNDAIDNIAYHPMSRPLSAIDPAAGREQSKPGIRLNSAVHRQPFLYHSAVRSCESDTAGS
jgi:hypothetical protein